MKSPSRSAVRARSPRPPEVDAANVRSLLDAIATHWETLRDRARALEQRVAALEQENEAYERKLRRARRHACEAHARLRQHETERESYQRQILRRIERLRELLRDTPPTGAHELSSLDVPAAKDAPVDGTGAASSPSLSAAQFVSILREIDRAGAGRVDAEPPRDDPAGANASPGRSSTGSEDLPAYEIERIWDVFQTPQR